MVLLPVIYEDTRQQAGKHDTKHRYFERHGIEIVRKKLDFGDYMRDGSNISIDTKKGLSEIVGNVGREHGRFVREIERANRAGYRIVFLIEEGKPIESLESVHLWVNATCTRCAYYKALRCDSVASKCLKYAHRPMTGETLQKILASMQLTHGCIFEFSHPLHTGRRICEILGMPTNAAKE